MAKLDPQIVAHLEWIGFVQPTGLVVSAPALVRAGAILDRRDAEGQRLLREHTEEQEFDPQEGLTPWLQDFRAFASAVLGWSLSPKGYAGTTESPIPPELEVPLPDYGETLRPDFAVRELEPQDGHSPWQLLVRVLELGEDFDRVVRGKGQLEASAHSRMERLLRQTGVPAGLLFNGRALRLVSAPRRESSGWLDFRVEDMVQTAGRPICTALRLLLGQPRLLSLPRSQRLAALLEDSRKFQNEVSERLAEQVLHALYELLRGFQSAHDVSKGELLRGPLQENPDEVYRALLTVVLRIVFLLYAEERDMLPEDENFLRYYSLAGLYERLREDAALFPDTMDQRYGAWAQLLVLFRMVFDGAECGTMCLPKRHGVLFDPDRFPFLEGRPSVGGRQVGERIDAPLVPDGTIYRALEKLLVLDGERISYRALDVEQ
ncbi:class I SAM-dependent DNA methyltransferase, partial [Acidobacteria bacterium AH-259-O06]|nr:class I SAM-dependent DNA methyltransferase [Acidobacteria bacterium AH-259-O06]